MTDLRTIARSAAGVFGGTPKVVRYHDDAEENFVDILSCALSPQAGLTSYSTIGMSSFDNDLTLDVGPPPRTRSSGSPSDGRPNSNP